MLGACGITKGFGESEHFTIKRLADVLYIIKQNNGVAIAAHVDRRNGLLHQETTLKKVLKKNLDSLTALEFCECESNNYSPELKSEIDKLAHVSSSDAHNPDDIGKSFSWIKMSKPNINNLKLALLDTHMSVKNQSENPNEFSDIFLTKLTIKSMKHCGRIQNKPFIIDLNPHFNSLIGGRGTGKSTIIEAIRIASRCDRNLESQAPEVSKQLKEFMRHSHDDGVILNDTEILLELQRRDKKYVLRWNYDGNGITVTEESSLQSSIDSKNLKERFPISIYSQKQINELSSNSSGLIDIIDNSKEVNRLELKSSWDSTLSKFFQLMIRKRELSRNINQELELTVKLTDIENDLKHYEEKGHENVLNLYQKRSQQKSVLSDNYIFDNLYDSLNSLVENSVLPDFPEHIFDEQDETTTEIKKIYSEIGEKFSNLRKSIIRIAKEVKDLNNQRTFKISSTSWKKSLDDSIEKYQKLIKEYEKSKTSIDVYTYGVWVRERNQLLGKLKSISIIQKEFNLLEIEVKQTKNKLLDLRKELFVRRANFIEKVIGKNDFVRMDLVQFGDTKDVEKKYRSILGIEKEKFKSSIYDIDNKQGVLWDFMNWEKQKVPKSKLSKLIFEIKNKTHRIARGIEDYGLHGKFVNYLNALYKEKPELFDKLKVWWPKDKLRVKYSKNSKFYDLNKGSIGQKSAAILSFLLSHGSEPLIIDQPEDDLDNALIYDLIVKQIRQNQNKRQFIIATHNPNIVVNGNSDLVNILKFKNGLVTLHQKGGLDEIEIRNEICNIMEGGREAFENRYKRIALEVE